MKKYFKIENYRFRYLSFKKKIKVLYLSKKKLPQIDFSYFNYKVPIEKNNNSEDFLTHYNILGAKINLAKIDWHKDEISNFEYPLVRFDNLKISKYFNKGIDFLIPWVKSRFHFLMAEAAAYKNSGNVVFYNKFKSNILDWDNKNPYLYGVLWYPPMDLSIGSFNLILAINIFSELIEEDKEFKNKLSEMIVKRGEYISKFIEVYENKHNTNHTTTDYAGLFFLSLALKDHPKHKIWINTGVKGIIECMDYQVNDDGGAFECSISYHRLVLEIFGLFAVFAIFNSIKLPNTFLIKLFKMFEYSASYVDKNGNAPKFGDCDSGRFVIIDNTASSDFFENENNHYNILQLGEYIFDHQFISRNRTEFNFGDFLPPIKQIDINSLNVTPRNYDDSISFNQTGLFILKNKQLDLCVASFPMGQNGRGGHNHYDFGSFTLSINGAPFLVDPGEYQYTRDKNERNKFRAYHYHNTLSNKWDLKNIERDNQEPFKWWGIHNLYTSKVTEVLANSIKIKINRIEDDYTRHRSFEILDDKFYLQDEYVNEFVSTFNFHPSVNILSAEGSKIITDVCEINLNGFEDYKIEPYDFAPYYGAKIPSKSLKVFSKKILKTSFLVSE